MQSYATKKATAFFLVLWPVMVVDGNTKVE